MSESKQKSQYLFFIVFMRFTFLCGYDCYQFFHAEDFSCSNPGFATIFDMNLFTANGLMVDDCIGINEDENWYDYADFCSDTCWILSWDGEKSLHSKPYPRPHLLDEWLEEGPQRLQALFDDDSSTCVILDRINSNSRGKVKIVKALTEDQENVMMKILKSDVDASCVVANVLYTSIVNGTGCHSVVRPCKLTIESGTECQVLCDCPGHWCQLEIMFGAQSTVDNEIVLCEIEKIIV